MTITDKHGEPHEYDETNNVRSLYYDRLSKRAVVRFEGSYPQTDYQDPESIYVSFE
ncbi:hypothetical protein [Nocardia sp. Marseille-Q1738]